MTAQEYLETKLKKLNHPAESDRLDDTDELVEAIFCAVLSKKFRKYSASEVLKMHIKNAVRLNVEKRQPINITFVHGAYKLWRLEEAPEADWAELFALMYYSNWVKPICDIYESGVWFDFFVDDLIVPHLGTASVDDVRAYLTSYQELMDFLHSFQPPNLRMTITTVGSRFASEEEFEQSLAGSIMLKQQELSSGLPLLTDTDKARVELNTKSTEAQLEDPSWREKVALIETAYSRTKAAPRYHKAPDKILAFTNSIPDVAIAVGSTRSSIAKFWVAVGALRRKGNDFSQVVLSPDQLQKADFAFENVQIDRLHGKNFTKIRCIQED
ncbi:hypothetical protein KBC77_04335 [Candidatus Saccharibacteria bacterium]|nr:hypothetical protein [Candidatus Saccharibacteria bacterium]